jgi:hypothetical protein
VVPACPTSIPVSDGWQLMVNGAKMEPPDFGCYEDKNGSDKLAIQNRA